MAQGRANAGDLPTSFSAFPSGPFTDLSSNYPVPGPRSMEKSEAAVLALFPPHLAFRAF